MPATARRTALAATSRRLAAAAPSRVGGTASRKGSGRVLTDAQRKANAQAKLHYGQTQAWLAHHKEGYRIISLFAGTGGGKTWFGPRFWYPIIRAKPGATFLFVEPTWRHLKRIMIPVIEEFFGAFNLGRMHYGDMAYNLHTGGRILFGSVDNPNSLQGVHVDGGIWGDEVGLYSEEAWDVMLQRAALYKAPILLTSTPYTLPWCEKRLAREADRSKSRGDKEYWLIQFPSYWNPMYPMDQYWRLKETWPADKFNRLMRGEFTRVGGLMFDSFDEEKHLATIYPIAGTAEYPYRLHYSHPKYGERIVNLVRTWAAQDWGWNPDPGVQLLYGQDAVGHIYVFDEHYETMVPVARGTEQGRDTWAARANRWVEQWGIEALWCDPSMPAYIADMQSYGVPAMGANAKVEYGTEVVNQNLHTQIDGEPGLSISIQGCPNLVRTIGTYVRKKGKGEDEYLPEPADGQDDHPEDCLRYGLVKDTKPGKKEGPSDVPALVLPFPNPSRRH